MAIKNIRPPASIPALPSLPWNLARVPLYDYLRKMWDAFAGRPNVFGDNIPVGTPSTGTGGSSGGTTNTVVKFTGAGDVATIGNSTITDDGTVVTANTSTTIRRSVSSDDSNSFFTVTGTLPAVTTGTAVGAHISVTSAGSSANAQWGTRSILNAGYTGASGTVGLFGQTAARGTGTNPFYAQGNAANIGLIGFSASGGGAGANVGTYGEAQSASGGNYGGFFEAGTTTAQGTYVGVAGFGMSVGGAHLRVGGYFGLITSTATLPTYESSALIADNSGETERIFAARDNGSRVYSIEDGGQQNFTTDASRSQHSGTKTLTEGAATSIVTVGLPQNSVCGFVVEWTVEANDATDYQSRCGSTYVAVVNKGGVLTTNVSDIGTSAIAVSAGTLTVATSVATGTNDVSFQLNATSSLTQTTLSATYFIRKMRGAGNISPL